MSALLPITMPANGENAIRGPATARAPNENPAQGMGSGAG